MSTPDGAETNLALGARESARGPTSDDRTWAMLAHVLTLVGSWLAPLVIFLIFQNERPFVVRHAKEALNFQITVLIASIVLLPTVCIGVGFVLLPALGIAALVLCVLAAIQANGGAEYRYPCTLRLVT
ncbi:MAG: DUF4870 domain-containing protein [Planctomycetota bacterium]